MKTISAPRSAPTPMSTMASGWNARVSEAAQATAAMVTAGQGFGPQTQASRAYQQINKVYAGLTAFTDPLFRSMADGLQGLERA